MAFAVVAMCLMHFNLLIYLLAIIIILIHGKMYEKTPREEIVYRWMSLLGLAVPLLFASLIHTLFPNFAAITIGYTRNPYQLEIAALELIYALFVVFAFRARYGYRMAIALSSLFVLWTDVTAHVIDMVQWHNYPHGNEISWLCIDFFVPIILLICSRRLKPR